VQRAWPWALNPETLLVKTGLPHPRMQAASKRRRDILHNFHCFAPGVPAEALEYPKLALCDPLPSADPAQEAIVTAEQ